MFSSYKNNPTLKIFKIITPIIALIFSFFVSFFFINLAIGDLPTLAYGGVIHPDFSRYRHQITISEYEEQFALYEQTKSNLGIPDFPLNFVYMAIKYITLDWGTNWQTGGSIFDELVTLFEPTIMLVTASLALIIAVLLPFMVVMYESRISYRNYRQPASLIVKILAILSPILLFLAVMAFFALIHGVIPPDFITPGLRDDANPLGRLVMPVILISSIAISCGLISLAFGSSNRTVSKIS